MRRARATLILTVLLLAGCGGGQQPPADGGSEAPAEPARQESTTQGQTGTTQASTLPTTTVTLVPSDGGEPVEVEAEVADDDAERQRGLMERTALAEDAGMLFVFGRERPLSFWMKNTLIPLSVAYIDSEGRIVDIQDMQPLDETPHPSAEPAQYALEVNQGFFEERGIEAGDRVEGLPE